MSELHNRIHVHFEEKSEGHCSSCKWWQTDADAQAGHDRSGLCLHQELAHFELQVSMDSGCNRYKRDDAGVKQFSTLEDLNI